MSETRQDSFTLRHPAIAAVILGFLDRIRTMAGDVATFLLRHGMSDDELTALCTRLLANRPEAPLPAGSAQNESSGRISSAPWSGSAVASVQPGA